MSDSTQFQLFFSDEFKERVRILAKRYRQIQSDLQPLIDNLQTGNLIGDQIPGTGYTVFRVRLKNSDIQKGKSAGYRVICQLQNSVSILLVTIYSKSDQNDIATDKIRASIAHFQATES